MTYLKELQNYRLNLKILCMLCYQFILKDKVWSNLNSRFSLHSEMKYKILGINCLLNIPD